MENLNKICEWATSGHERLSLSKQRYMEAEVFGSHRRLEACWKMHRRANPNRASECQRAQRH